MNKPYTITVNRQCDRCPRVDREEVSVDDVVKLAKGTAKPVVPSMVATLDGGTPAEFGFLCATCRTIVKRYYSAMVRKIEKHSALREKGTIEIEEAE